MENKNKILAANILFNHRLNKTGLKNLPKKLIPSTIDESYQIQNELKILYMTLIDNHIIGKKVGCTNKYAQDQVNVFEPFYGNLFSKYSNISGCKLKSSKFYKPFIEPEISFRLRDDININKGPFKIKDANVLFDIIFPSIEIVDFRFGNNIKDVGIKNLIITNGASEYYIKSKNFLNLNDVNLSNQVVELYVNNNLVDTGNTNLVLQNPINSAIWLVNKLIDSNEPMLKGQYISTGTCTKAFNIKKNSFIKADFGKLGSVEFEYI